MTSSNKFKRSYLRLSAKAELIIDFPIRTILVIKRVSKDKNGPNVASIGKTSSFSSSAFLACFNNGLYLHSYGLILLMMTGLRPDSLLRWCEFKFWHNTIKKYLRVVNDISGIVYK